MRRTLNRIGKYEVIRRLGYGGMGTVYLAVDENLNLKVALKEYLPDDIARNHPQHELEIAAAEGSYEEEGWRRRKDGTTFWANVVITADEGVLS